MSWHLGCQKIWKLLVLFWYLGILKNNQSTIFWYCFKIIIEVFQHFTFSNFLSCGSSLSFSCHLILVQIRFSHIFLTALNLYLKWYWIINFHAAYSVTLGNVSDSSWFWTSSFYWCKYPRNTCKERPNGLCNINLLQSYLAAACIAKMILIVVWRQRAMFSILPLKDTYLYQTFIFRYYKHTVHNWLNWYLLEIYGREWTAFNNWIPRLSLYLRKTNNHLTRQHCCH